MNELIFAENTGVESHPAPANAPTHIEHTNVAPAHSDGSAPQPAHENQDSHSSVEMFTHLLKDLGDEHAFVWGNVHICDLPIMFFDEGSFHFYSGEHAMETAKEYTIHNGKIVREHDQKPVGLDVSITNLVFFQWLAIFILGFLFIKAGSRAKKDPTKAPKGIHNILEMLVLYIRDEIILPNIPSKNAVKSLTPYLTTLFMFIMGINLLGLAPGGHTSTGNLATTATLAITAFIAINITAIRVSGIKAWLHHLLGGAPWYMSFIMVPIEILGLFIKPIALTIRLFANMMAGHLVLLSLIGLIFILGLVIAPVSIAFSIFMYFLELLVAFLQAYIFTTLTSVFIGLAIGDHAHETAHH